MKTLQELQLQWGESTCGRSLEQYIYDYFKDGGIATDLKNANIKLADANFVIANMKHGIKKYCFHWDSYFSNKIVGNPPVIQDLKDLIK